MHKRPGKMHLFKSREPNLVHYVTAVTYNRVPVFRSERACILFIEVLVTHSREGAIQTDRLRCDAGSLPFVSESSGIGH